MEEKENKQSESSHISLRLFDKIADKNLPLYSIKDPKKEKYTGMRIRHRVKNGIDKYQLSCVTVVNGIDYYTNINLRPLSTTKYKPKEKGEVELIPKS